MRVRDHVCMCVHVCVCVYVYVCLPISLPPPLVPPLKQALLLPAFFVPLGYLVPNTHTHAHTHTQKVAKRFDTLAFILEQSQRMMRDRAALAKKHANELNKFSHKWKSKFQQATIFSNGEFFNAVMASCEEPEVTGHALELQADRIINGLCPRNRTKDPMSLCLHRAPPLHIHAHTRTHTHAHAHMRPHAPLLSLPCVGVLPSHHHQDHCMRHTLSSRSTTNAHLENSRQQRRPCKNSSLCTWCACVDTLKRFAWAVTHCTWLDPSRMYFAAARSCESLYSKAVKGSAKYRTTYFSKQDTVLKYEQQKALAATITSETIEEEKRVRSAHLARPLYFGFSQHTHTRARARAFNVNPSLTPAPTCLPSFCSFGSKKLEVKLETAKKEAIKASQK